VKIARVLLSLGVALVACTPRITPNYTFEPVGEDRALELAKPFQKVLDELGIRMDSGQSFRYEGDDDRAFLVAADGFYTAASGFCPLQSNAFHFLEDRAVFMTVAAKGLQVRLFVYDRSARPRFEFAYLNAESVKKLEVTPCRTAGGANI
jgi:hypothetical protein